MQDTAMGEEGAVALARALEHNSVVTTLELGVCGAEGEEKGKKTWSLDTHLHAVQ